MPSSDSEFSEPVLVSEPSSPSGGLKSMTDSRSSSTSLQPEPRVITDTETRHVTALSPTEPENTTTGLGRRGEAQLDRLNTSSVLGGTEAVVGPAHGDAPEYIATLQRQPSGATTEDTETEVEDDGGSTKGPKWLRRVKDGVSSIKEKAASTSSGHKDRSDSASITSSVFGTRDRSHTNTSAHGPQAVKIITDEHGNPVPVEVGVTESPNRVSFDRSVKRDDFAHGQSAAPSLVDSTATSVKEKVLENFDVVPKTSQEKFHSMFKDISNQEELIEDYRCALVRDIPVQGKLYLSEHYLSFHAAILGWETNLTIPWSEIVSIEKRMTAKVIPNAIEVTTLHASHTFSSFLARDATFKLIASIWEHVHPGENMAPGGSATSTPYTVPPEQQQEPDSDVKSQISFEDEKGEKKFHKFKTGFAAMKNHLRSASLDTRKSAPTEAEMIKNEAQAQGSAGGHAATTYDGPEYKNEALDCILPTSPDKAYELFFTNEAFLKKFLEEKENLSEVDIGAWKPVDGAADGENTLKERDMSYLKPLNAPVGPKQTHCHIHDQNDKMDPETCISNLTTTKTPDVPSGDNFATVTRSTFTWAQGGGTHVRVTTEVEWTKVNRMLRGVIERGAVDGQKTYHKDLEAAVRAHIEANKEEYGVETSGEAPPPPVAKQSSNASSTDGGFFDSLPVSPIALLIGLVVILGLTNFFTLLSLRHQASVARNARLGHPVEISNAVSRVLADFDARHSQRVAGPAGGGVAGEVEQLKKVLAGLEKHVVQIAGQVTHAVNQIKEVSDRMDGVRTML
ncbi:GRAM and VASt domain-containing protein [Sporobolomyces koalae]|uniref:GRAM and VASt domain-containing protein n=1 Tax=Sporobolomyces koalae TaxID=500713 RepID=UPI0031787AB5